MKRVFVTGGTGKVGTRFVPRLLKQGHHVRMLVRRETPETRRFAELGAELSVGDILESRSIEGALAGVDTIVHLAAFFRGATPEQAKSVNQTATVNLAKSALAAGIQRFVFASTSLVYGPNEERAVREFDGVHCEVPYPVAKAAGEEALLQLHRSESLDLRILRFAFVYGEGDPHLTESLPMIKDWAASKRLQLVHHADVSQALLLALQTDGIDGEIFNVADDAPLTLGELRSLYKVEDPGDQSSKDQRRSAWDVTIDTLKIRLRLGYRPIFPTLYSAWAAGAL